MITKILKNHFSLCFYWYNIIMKSLSFPFIYIFSLNLDWLNFIPWLLSIHICSHLSYISIWKSKILSKSFPYSMNDSQTSKITIIRTFLNHNGPHYIKMSKQTSLTDHRNNSAFFNSLRSIGNNSSNAPSNIFECTIFLIPAVIRATRNPFTHFHMRS